jgi:predicted TPR repeat methyltransferase
MDAKNQYWRAYRGLFHIAPDKVLLAATEFHMLAFTPIAAGSEEAYVEKFRGQYATMLGEMRSDAFGQTHLSKTMIEERLPIIMQLKS